MTVFLIIIGAIVALHIIGFIIVKIIGRRDIAGITPPGQFVTVNGKQMHLRVTGNDPEKDTLVLLPGLNIVQPTIDFRPLADGFVSRYNVVSIDYFGYGFSDQTDTPRTNENFVAEIRAALKGAGFPPPYVFMPFSASGIICEYYAAKYPDEVKALILLDTPSSAEQEGGAVPRFVFGISKFQKAVGLTRLTNKFVFAKIVGLTEENGYTKDEIDIMKRYANHALNDTLIDHNVRFHAGVAEVIGMEFPENVPVLAVRADGYSKGKWPGIIHKHMQKLGSQAKMETIAGSNHTTIYHTKKHREAVIAVVRKFLT